MCKDDIMIICGDAGIVWLDEEKDRELIAWYDSRPWTTVYCDGNHEGFARLQEYPVTDFHGARAHKLECPSTISSAERLWNWRLGVHFFFSAGHSARILIFVQGITTGLRRSCLCRGG